MRNEEKIEKLIGISIVVAMITLALAIGGLVIGVIS
jgi:hypothetical protein